MKNSPLKRAEAAALMAVCITMCFAVRVQAKTQPLRDNVIRLHVIAASDSDSEQALKIRVRDRVLEYITPRLAQCESPEEAQALIRENLSDVRDAALSASDGRSVAVEFDRQGYGTRISGGCTLPAGTYNSLRVIIGEGEGHNWWGVIFPELSVSPASGYTDAIKLLGEDGLRLVTEGENGYVLRFRVLEWLQELETLFAGK